VRSRLSESWDRFWFEPTSPSNLGLCRVAFFGATLWLHSAKDFSGWADVSDVFWMPVYSFRVLHVPVLSSEILELLQVLWKLALWLSCIGFLTRLSTVTSFLLGFYLLGLPHSFGKTDHGDAALVFVLGIMAVSHCGDGWSIDRLVGNALHDGPERSLRVRSSGEYTWPIRLVWVLLALIFFGAGLAKLRNSGLAWIASDNLAMLLLVPHYPIAGTPLTSWGPLIAQYDWACRALAATTVALELSYPLALVRREARWGIVPATCSMLIAIRVLMGPGFSLLVICHVFWVPWERVRRWCADWLPRGERTALTAKQAE
jgi:hypothetical protein